MKGYIHNVFCILLLTVSPLLFPKIGEQQYSYVQGLCFLSLAWLALAFQIRKHKQTMVLRSMDIAVGVCLLALLLHVFWIQPVRLSVWRWVDAVGLFAFYVFVRLSSHREIKVLVACVMVGGTAVACVAFSVYGLKVVSELDAYDRKDKEHVFCFRDNIAFVRRHCQETLERGDTVQAIQILNDAIGRIPVAGFYQQRAKLYAETGDYQKAEKEYRFLRNLVPTSWDTVLELARLYQRMDRKREALDLLEPYTKISPKDKTLEQKAMLLEIRELYQAIKKRVSK